MRKTEITWKIGRCGDIYRTSIPLMALKPFYELYCWDPAQAFLSSYEHSSKQELKLLKEKLKEQCVMARIGTWHPSPETCWIPISIEVYRGFEGRMVSNYNVRLPIWLLPELWATKGRIPAHVDDYVPYIRPMGTRCPAVLAYCVSNHSMEYIRQWLDSLATDF